MQCRILARDEHEARRRHLAVGHAANASTQPFPAYAAVRFNRALRRVGWWWLGEVDGEAVSSLLCYPLTLRDATGARVPAYGLGAVATRPDARRKGYARRLCEAAIAAAEAEGRRVGLLYSAIPPAYYERLGFAVCPAAGFLSEDPAEVAASGEQARLLPCDPLVEPAPYLAAYHAHLRGLRPERDLASWTAAWTAWPEDWCFAIDGGPGYVRVNDDGDEVAILELCPAPGTSPQPAVRAVAALTVQLGRARLCGWLLPDELAGTSFRDVGRARTLPMLRGVTAEEAAGARFFGSDHF